MQRFMMHTVSCTEETASRRFGPEFLRNDLGHYLGPEFRGETLDRYIPAEPQPSLPLYHLVGAVDPITAADIAA